MATTVNGRRGNEAWLRLRRLELGLARIRWFGLAFGLFQTWQVAVNPPEPPGFVIPSTLALLGVLAGGNWLITWAARRSGTAEGLRRIGLAAFALDILVILSITWIYSYDERGATWVVIYVLPMEGAIRYQVRGAAATIALALASELPRELYLDALFPDHEFLLHAVTFRVGVLAIIAMVAGFMARSLARQAEEAERRAWAFEDLAARESAGRRELAAFHETILAGVAGQDPQRGLESMAEAITRHVGYPGLAIHMVEDDGLRCRAARGLAAGLAGRFTPHGQGLVGHVAATGQPALAEDATAAALGELTSVDGSAMAAPMQVGDLVIGVIEVSAEDFRAFDASAVEALTRLTGQVALVALQAVLLAEREETVRRLQELDQMRSEFVAITSHELRTPITSIRGFARTLADRLDDIPQEEAREFLSVIDSQSERLARLVNDLLVVSRIEARRLELQVEDVDVGMFLERVAGSFDGGRKGLIEVDLPDAPISARFDPGRLEQVLHNLLDNAVKFSPPDQAVILGATNAGDAVEFRVQDRGVGIPPEEIPRIFERFHQVGDPLTREQAGVGLGLYISKRIVDEMGGEIRVSSGVGEGTTFRIRLPQRTPDPVL